VKSQDGTPALENDAGATSRPSPPLQRAKSADLVARRQWY